MTDVLSRLRGLEKQATPGPWQSRDRVTCHNIFTPDLKGAILEAHSGDTRGFPSREERAANADLVAAARNHLPALLAVAEAAQYTLTMLESVEYEGTSASGDIICSWCRRDLDYDDRAKPLEDRHDADCDFVRIVQHARSALAALGQETP